jgi:hypothetical protein
VDPLGLAIWLLVRGRVIRAARVAWRWLLIRLGIRRITPGLNGPIPGRLTIVEPLGDTGGAYRPKHRPQDPAKDPDEPYGGESSARGQDHGWSGCTMSSGADAMAYGSAGELTPWGGRLRHAQSDLEGGTDLQDLREAFEELGETLTIKSGQGWGAVVDAHEAGRAIVIQGTGEVPGAGDFAGGHACCIGTETHSDGRWLWGDPLCSDWQWIQPGAIRSWAERWQSSIAFAVAAKPQAPPPPEPPPPPAPPPAPCYSREDLELAVEYSVDAALVAAGDALVGGWLEWIRAPRPAPVDSWDRGSWADAELEVLDEIEGDETDPCAPGEPASWSRGRLPFPVEDALAAMLVPATWDASDWRAAAWRA